ncbi:hypothetical protein MNBD_CHLOROFLEXI01-3780 [hydrothermal vent metagenome]|uniref:Uncharacterized protein n=1 Tax=hydrothermal vent metagenome TaxID=652676 RepID=A0A3B0UIN2_9ZZZZ
MNFLSSAFRPFSLLATVFLLVLSGCQPEPDESQPEGVTEPIMETATSASSGQAVSSTTPPSSPTLPPPILQTATQPSEAAVLPTAVSTPEGANLPGALIAITMESQVGVLLDEIPAEMRDLFADQLLAQSAAEWESRALRQLRLTRNRLTFRDFVYIDKGQLPLPPPELWQIRLDPNGPTRQTIQGHDLVMIGYSFSSTLLTDAQSPGEAEPALAEVGGIWDEPFVFPADPDLLLQRTSNACVNEGGYPPDSFDSENIWHFYDYDCTADSGGAAGCHRSILPTLSCREALKARVGEVETTVRFERLAWDDGLANQVRLGDVTSWGTPDLTAVTEDLATNRIVYKYFAANNCALEEGSVGSSGWRRLLQFEATVWNKGTQPLHIGKANVEDTENNVFTYSPCHAHLHYTNYGTFFLQNQADLTSSKQAFCVQSTDRMSNNETSPLIHDYSCSFQGIQAGWADEYIAGLDTQWIDITDLDVPPDGITVQLGFTSNSDQFLCEGTLIMDEDGVQLWEPSGFTTENGESINRMQCDFIPDWDVSNQAVYDVFVPQSGSFVTTPCVNGEISPLRNCGFVEVEVESEEGEAICELGTAVNPTIPESFSYPLIIRVCERSASLGVGVACTFTNSLVNTTVASQSEPISFACPQMRDSEELSGGYALYVSLLNPED